MVFDGVPYDSAIINHTSTRYNVQDDTRHDYRREGKCSRLKPLRSTQPPSTQGVGHKFDFHDAQNFPGRQHPQIRNIVVRAMWQRFRMQDTHAQSFQSGKEKPRVSSRQLVCHLLRGMFKRHQEHLSPNKPSAISAVVPRPNRVSTSWEGRDEIYPPKR